MTVIESARRAAGLSQQRLAEIARTQQSSVSEYESSTLRGNLGLPFVENRYSRARREGTPLPTIAGAEQALVTTA